jgi:hypothetical protein
MNTNAPKYQTERSLEKLLNKLVTEEGGLSFKLSPVYVKGLPDRLVLHKGRAIFVEMKAPGKVASRMQLHIHAKLAGVGFKVEVLSTDAEVLTFIRSLRC